MLRINLKDKKNIILIKKKHTIKSK
jgi:hypothetical protein